MQSRGMHITQNPKDVLRILKLVNDRAGKNCARPNRAGSVNSTEGSAEPPAEPGAFDLATIVASGGASSKALMRLRGVYFLG